jgi:hypothetical protein
LSDLLKEPEKSSLSLPGEKTKQKPTKEKQEKTTVLFCDVSNRVGTVDRHTLLQTPFVFS